MPQLKVRLAEGKVVRSADCADIAGAAHVPGHHPTIFASLASLLT